MISRRHIPNLLTVGRIATGVLVFALMAALAAGGRRELATAAFVLFSLGALTDFFDGWLARRWRVPSAWGAALDPIADKIAVLAAVLGLVLAGAGLEVGVPGFVILFREMFVSGLREAGRGPGREPARDGDGQVEDDGAVGRAFVGAPGHGRRLPCAGDHGRGAPVAGGGDDAVDRPAVRPGLRTHGPVSRRTCA